ncbi:MAG: Fic family protein, partial [Candidatus Binatia bacterium]
ELKGVAATIPNQRILLSALALLEAKESSAVENIITTHDELFKSGAFPSVGRVSPAAKEVRRYAHALQRGYDRVRETGVLTNRYILEIQAAIEQNTAGFRKLPGTVLKDGAGRTIFTPPQDPALVLDLMGDLEGFINDDERFRTDPLVKMAVLHHQFESIHPFYDGNGRTGRIINVLYLVRRSLLDIPVLYLSRHIVRTKGDYYRLLQAVRERGAWEEWVLYVLKAVEMTSGETINTIGEIREALMAYKHEIRERYHFYSQDLVNSLFHHPYTRIEYLVRDLKVTRKTAAKYLDQLAKDGLLDKHKFGRSNYYINRALVRILIGEDDHGVTG